MTTNLDATYGTFLTTRLEMRLAGDWGDYQRGSATAGALATFIHEHMHFFQAIFTGYGHIQWSSHRQMNGFLVSEWKQSIPFMDGKSRMPLANCALTPELNASSRFLHETALEQIRIGKARFSMQFGSLTLKECGSLTMNHEWRANPLIEISGKQRVLQTKDILESHAHFVERTFLERVANLEQKTAWFRGDLPDKYTAAYDWFIQECGLTRKDEFPAICDLSMQILWKPVIPTTENEWRASNPAWRFFALTRTLANHTTLSLGPPDAWPKNYEKFCEDLLTICGYPQLNEVFEERLTAFSRLTNLMDIEKLMRTGIEFRQKHPWCAVNPVTDLKLWSDIIEKFKSPFVVVGEQMGNFGEPSVPGGEVIFELQYQALAAQILGDFSPVARQTGNIECAFGKYGIPNGCSFQASHGCEGRFNTREGVPHAMTIDSKGQLGGCSFGWLLQTIGIKSEDIELHHEAKFSPLSKTEISSSRA